MAKAKQVSSWGDIPQEVFEAFSQAVETLHGSMIPRDCDGDSPIEVLIVNKMTHEGIGYFPVPRNQVYSYETHGYLEVHPDKQQELDDATERELTNNVHAAGEALNRYMQLKQHHHWAERERKRPFADRIKEACVSCKRKIGFDPDHKDDFYGRTREKHPDYPAKYHSDGLECKAFELRRIVWELNHPELRGKTPKPRWCMNADCRCKLPNHNSKRGVKDMNVCVNPRCGQDNSKHYPDATPDE